MNKVLIITYYWPPSGGAGVQRWLKFSKYLPEFGWNPVILTVDPDYATYPAIDPSLNKDIPAGVEVFRTKVTDWFRFYRSDKSKIPSGGFASNKDDSFRGKFFRFIRGNFFIPDPRRGWNRHALKKAADIIIKENIKYVITTSPPHSTQLIGLALKMRFPGITWTADLRDLWTDIYYYELFYPTFISRSIDRYYEKKVLRKADRIITVGEKLAETFISKSDEVKRKVFIVTNGYDEEDFDRIDPVIPEILTITYVGTLSEIYPLDGFLAALKEIETKGMNIILKFAGSVPDIIRSKINAALSGTKIEFIQYLPHQEAINLMTGSSILLLIIPETLKNETIIPGKVFEYIAAEKPVLCLGPEESDTAGIIEKCRAGKSVNYNDSEGILDFIENHKKYSSLIEKSAKNIFSRYNLTKELVKVFNPGN